MSNESQASAERINLVYRSSHTGREEDIELPFRLLVLGNFSGDAKADYFGEQDALNINKDNFSNVMQALSPNIAFVVEDKLGDEPDQSIDFSFTFNTLDDFGPKSLITQSPLLADIATLRNELLEIRGVSQDNDDALKNYIESFTSDSMCAKFMAGISEGSTLSYEEIDACVTELDDRLSAQLDSILHHPQFRKLEALWRSLAFVIDRTSFDENCVVEILNVSKDALREDLEDSPELVRSELYHTVYSKEFGQFGGKPYSCIVADYTFGPNADDVWLLQQIAGVAAMSHAPFLAAPSPDLFDVDSFSDLVRLRDLSANFEQPRFTKWNTFRQSDDARYVGLALPGFLLRNNYGEDNEIGVFPYRERVKKTDKALWGNAAFALATRLLDSFAKTRWCMNVIGSEFGEVEGLRMLGDAAVATREKKIPTEVLISDRRESELNLWGFIPLAVHKGDDNAAFYSAASVQAPRRFADTEEGKNAALNFQLGAQLPYLFIVSRLSHYIKMMQREHLGSWKKGPEIEQELGNWIRQYVSEMDNPAPNVRIRRPLRMAEIGVSDVPGKSDWYMVSLKVVPHLKYMGTQFTLSEVGKLDKH